MMVGWIRSIIKLVSVLIAWFLVVENASSESHDFVLQILSYRDGKLLNQGTGVQIGDDLVVTADHLDLESDHLRVANIGGSVRDGIIIARDPDRDVALLQVRGLDGTAAKLIRPDDELVNRTLIVKGYWSLKEPAQAPKFLGKKRPRFLPSVQVRESDARVSVRSVENGYIDGLGIVGRGAYGAPLIDHCGRVAGIVVGAPEKSRSDLWARHRPDTELTILNADVISKLVSSVSEPVGLAEPPCTPASSQALGEAESQLEAARRDADEANRRADEEREKRGLVERDKSRETQRADAAEAEVLAQQELVEEIADVAELNRLEREKTGKQRQFFLRVSSISMMAVGVLGALFAWQMRQRRSDQKIAKKALETASARFHDCLLQGKLADGTPIAIKISGGDLQHEPEGVVLGRNPQQSQFIIGDDTVSRRHARLSLNDGGLEMEDLDSKGGTRLNGKLISSRIPTEIKTGDVIELGGVRLTFDVLED